MSDEPRWWSFAELDAQRDAFDAIVEATPEIDTFCSSSDWILPACAAFAPDATPLVRLSRAGVLALAARRVEGGGGRWACPLEAVWGLASPLIGPDPAPLVAAALALLAGAVPPTTGRLVALALCGLAEDGAAERALLAHARRGFLAEPGPEMARIVASLEGGMDGFWSRRSPKFRANARRARRQAAAAGIQYEYVTAVTPEVPLARLWQRILQIEAKSRKAAIGGGLSVPEMRVFYERMLPRLAARGALRVVFARRGEDDLAFVFGGIFGGVYRGLQVSFDDRFAAESPGVLVHLEMLERLCVEGVSGYDLGTDMEYKRRWGEVGLVTRTWLVSRRRV
jgi:CelD/BcsL family acetyltransferase involved in cellulose biosynthesis